MKAERRLWYGQLHARWTQIIVTTLSWVRFRRCAMMAESEEKNRVCMCLRVCFEDYVDEWMLRIDALIRVDVDDWTEAWWMWGHNGVEFIVICLSRNWEKHGNESHGLNFGSKEYSDTGQINIPILFMGTWFKKKKHCDFHWNVIATIDEFLTKWRRGWTLQITCSYIGRNKILFSLFKANIQLIPILIRYK